MQKHIFRMSDIRAIVPTELSMQDSYHIAQACVLWFVQQCPNLQRIAVAFDGRVHGQEMYQQVSQAIIDAGFQVYFLGICPTPVFMYGLHQLPVQAGIMITGSGSSAEYNGFKIFFDKKLVQDADLLEIYELSHRSDSLKKSGHLGKIIPCPIIEQYVDGIWQEFAHLSEYDFDILIDCGNGAAGPVTKKLIQRMGWKQVETVCESVDGTFPVHNPEPMNFKNMNFLKSELKKKKKLFGIAFDGDGDRMLAMESNGHMILGDRLLAIFVPDILAKHGHAVVLHDMQQALSEIIVQNQGKAVHVNSELIRLEQNIQKHHAIFAAQLHGRFFFQDRHPGYSDGMYVMLRLLDVLVKHRTTMADLLKRIDQQMRSVQSRQKFELIPDMKEL